MYLIPIPPINASFNFNWRQFGKLSLIGESVGIYWQKFSGLSPIGQNAEDIITGECPVDACQWRKSDLPNSYWRSSGNPL